MVLRTHVFSLATVKQQVVRCIIYIISYKNQNQGFIALTATLILTAVLMVVLTTNSTASYFARFDALGNQNKKSSQSLSDSCANAALLKISEDYNYTVSTGGEIVSVGGDECLIVSVKCIDSPCEDSSVHTKHLEIKTSAQYPSQNGSWSTSDVKIFAQNPSSAPVAPIDPITIESWN
jgi:hypothetical protein